MRSILPIQETRILTPIWESYDASGTLAPPFFFVLVGLFVILLVLIQLGALRYAYTRLGISSNAALLLLFSSLVGRGS